MSPARLLLCAAMSLFVFSLQKGIAQDAGSSDQPTIQVTSNLVFLDVTVLDKKGRPVVSGLAKDDFTITEEKKPQRIFSFEAPDAHISAGSEKDRLDGKAPLTIFVLDQLNSSFDELANLRDELYKHLAALPARLTAPAELMVVGNNNLELVQGYTRNRSELLFALDHLPGAVPFKRNDPSFILERSQQSIDTLQQIALQNKGVPGRKNVVWLGHGALGLSSASISTGSVIKVRHYLHATANMLVDARISLFVIYPGPKLARSSSFFAPTFKSGDFEGGDPFAGDINFVDFVHETGGDIFYNRNDIESEINESQVLGSRFYTLTYQPHEFTSNGGFKKIHVTLRNPDLRVVTKSGYFAPEDEQEVDPRHRAVVSLSEAAHSTIPITALELKIVSIVQHPDSGTAELTVRVNSQRLDWHKKDDGTSAASFYLAVASLSADKGILASKFGKITGVLHTQDPARLAAADCEFTVPVRVPKKTRNVRMMMESEDTGQIGTVDVIRSIIESAPAKPTPESPLTNRSAEERPAANTASR